MRMQLKVSIFVHPIPNLTLFMSAVAHSLNWYRFIGRILGKAMYEGILVDVAFAGFFLAKVKRSVLELEFHQPVFFFSGWENKVS